MRLCLRLAAIAVILLSSEAEARVFSFANETFSTYFGGTFGLSRVQDSGFGGAGGAGVTINGKSTMNTSGEFGILFSLPGLILKIGGEFIVPKPVVDASGKNSSGTEYFIVNSRALALTPSAFLEFPLQQTPLSRTLLGVGFGWATVSLDNDFALTTIGHAVYPGVEDHVESSSGQTGIYSTYFGYETHFTDMTTVFFNLGYRWGVVRSLASTKTNTAITGPQQPGTELVNTDGSRRTLDLSGAFVGVSFRFYL